MDTFVLNFKYCTSLIKELEPLEILISLITMFFAGYTSLKLYRQNKQLKDLAKVFPKIDNFQDTIKYYEGKQTVNPVALALSLVPHASSIRNDVEQFLSTSSLAMDIEEIKMDGINNTDDIEKFLNELREKRNLFDLQGRTEVHLFVQGPVVAGVLIGSMFDNWKPIKLYHKPIRSIPAIYQYWCPLVK